MADWILLANGKIKVSENNTGAIRNATIKVTNEENADEATIKITQGFKEYVLHIGILNIAPITAYSTTATDYQVDLSVIEAAITSYLKNEETGNINKDITITVKSGPATISNDKVIFTENETIAERTVVLLVTQDESGLTSEVTLKQVAGTHEYTFTAAPTLTVNHAAQEINPNVTSYRMINGHKREEVDWDVTSV